MRYQRKLKLVCCRAWATGIQVSICVCCSGLKEISRRLSGAAKSEGRLSLALARLYVEREGKTGGAEGLFWAVAGEIKAQRIAHGATRDKATVRRRGKNFMGYGNEQVLVSNSVLRFVLLFLIFRLPVVRFKDE